MLTYITRHWWWPGMAKLAAEFAQACSPCQHSRVGQGRKGLGQQEPAAPGTEIEADSFTARTPGAEANEYRFIIMIDRATSFAWTRAVPNNTAEAAFGAVAGKLNLPFLADGDDVASGSETDSDPSSIDSGTSSDDDDDNDDDDDDDERPKHRVSSSFSSHWTSAIDAIVGRVRALASALARRGPDDGGVVSRRGDDHDDREKRQLSDEKKRGVEWRDDPRAFRIASQLAPHLGASSAEHVRDLLTAMVLCECVYKSSDAEVRSKVAEFQAEFPPG